ncbi:MAG: T9SS type A sorting domain-containing protein, partial [Bacteroidetes bacterium]|nr:T9SS type A sorting domain-containing protein [Bacteroidota bacterium]
IHFADESNGYAVGNDGIIVHTINGGNVWLAQNSSTAVNLYGVYSSTPQIAWAVGDGGTILKTTNSGEDWIQQTSGTPSRLNAIYFTDTQSGWAVGDVGVVRRTVDGGQTWTAQLSGAAVPLLSVVFVNPKIGWAVGAEGVIINTNNGGESWKGQPSGTANNLSGISAVNDSTGWIAGNGGTILKITGKREAVVIGVNEFANNEEYNRFEQIPNPAVHSATVRFSVKQQNAVSLSLHTMAGNKVLTVIDNVTFNAGTFSMPIEFDDLSEGVYFYHLRVGAESHTEKVIITR